MLMVKSWSRERKRKTGWINLGTGKACTKVWAVDFYTGWFLFGVIPLYVRRQRDEVT